MKELLTKRFLYYKELGDKTFLQLSEDQIFWQYNEESNSVAIIVKHIAGNMLSRWTNFLTEDGEKPWRDRDQEFENNFKSKEEVILYWEKGWHCLLEALTAVTDDNLQATIYIRGEAHTVLDALLRQLAHYPYHIGQIVYAAKMIKNTQWETLSIARNKSQDYNKSLYQPKEKGNASPICFENSDEVRKDYKI